MLPVELTSKQQWNKRYRESAKGKIAATRGTIKWKHSNPDKVRAISVVNNAVRDGWLTRVSELNCQFCSKMAEQYHHPDYTKPLEVTPVCDTCHKILSSIGAIKLARRAASIFANTLGLFSNTKNGTGVGENIVRISKNPVSLMQGGMRSTSGSSARLKNPNAELSGSAKEYPSRTNLTGQDGKYRTPGAILGNVLPHTIVGSSEIAACVGEQRPLNRKLGCEIPKTLFDVPNTKSVPSYTNS